MRIRSIFEDNDSSRTVVAVVGVLGAAVLFVVLLFLSARGAPKTPIEPAAHESPSTSVVESTPTTAAQPGAFGATTTVPQVVPEDDHETPPTQLPPIAANSKPEGLYGKPVSNATGAVIVRVATEFTTAWARPNLSPEEWQAGLMQYTTDGYQLELATVDPGRVPASKVTGPATLASRVNPISVNVPTDAGVMKVTFSAVLLMERRVLVLDIQPLDDTR